ncbi:MAG: hypothetical protein IIY06_09730 [Proteobacteria bacterium]|nr:hypothetical protein [Pseudomonadota bacterium]
MNNIKDDYDLKSLLKNNRHSQRFHALILTFLVIAAATASGCRLDDSFFKKYSGTCRRYCTGVENLDEDGCLKLKGTCHPNNCVNEKLPEDDSVTPATDEETCLSHAGNWKPGYCVITEQICKEKVTDKMAL